MRYEILTVALCLAALTTFTAGAQSAPPASAEDPTLQRIKQDGRIIIGNRKDAAPFSFVDDKGRAQGYSIELCKHIADAVKSTLKLEKLDLVYREVTPGNHLDMLNAGTVDIVCGATTNTLKRRERAAFTLLTFITGSSALLPAESDLRSPADLEGRKVGVRADTTTDKAVSAGAARRGITVDLIRFPNHEAGLKALEAGEIDVYMADRILLISLADKAAAPEKLRLSDRFFTYQPYALMVRRDAPDFLLIADRALAGLYRSRQVKGIFENWLAPLGEQIDELQIRAMYRLQSIPEG
jgi:glutamate/aspartate transport system substrate-binding protein